MLHKLLANLDTQKDLIIHWQTELTSRPALGPDNNGQGEAIKAEWILSELKSIGLNDITEYPALDSRVECGFRPNIVARLAGKSSQCLWLIAHMDVVPEGNVALWQGYPFALRVEGDYVYGRGVEDNQQAIVSSMLLAKAILSTGTVPDLSLGLIFVADEETGMTYGLPHVLKEAPELIAPDDLVLVPDMGNSTGTMIEIAEKSCFWLRVTVSGKQCHASNPQKGINSLFVASACVLALDELYVQFSEKDSLYSPAWSTFVPSKKEANVENINTVPGLDVFYLDCRVLPCYNLDEVLEQSQKIVDKVAQKFGATALVEVVHKAVAPLPTSPESPIVQKLLSTLRNQFGKEAKLFGSGGQTVASYLRHKNIPTAVWSTLVPNPHTPNERSSISNTISDAKTMLSLLFI